ncbi:MAG: hypothetical protein AAFN11_15610 [Chloroflexota bacterium]
MRLISSALISLLLILTACNALPQQAEPTATRRFSAPTLQPSPIVQIQNSDEIYGDSVRDGQSDPTAAALPVDSALPPAQVGLNDDGTAQVVQIVITDALTATGTLYGSGSTDDRLPGLLIVSGAGDAWGAFPQTVADVGYSVLVVDLPVPATADIIGVLLNSFTETGRVDPARVVVMGANATADTALIGCATYIICDAVILLTPVDRNLIINTLPDLNPRPIFATASRTDANNVETASLIVASASVGSEFAEQASGNGAGMLALNGGLADSIIAWLSTLWIAQ